MSFPEGVGAEGITYRNYSLAVEGLLLTGDGTLLSFVETLSFSGGGPTYGHIETLTGLPVKQQLRNYTVYRVTQQGQAVGISGYPSVPGPLWPAALMRGGSSERRSPRRIGNSYTEYPITWQYEFEAAFPLYGNPTRW